MGIKLPSSLLLPTPVWLQHALSRQELGRMLPALLWQLQLELQLGFCRTMSGNW